MDRRLTFYPLFGKSLSIAVKAVIAGDSTPDSYLGEYNEKWVQPSEEDGTPETHLSLKGKTAVDGTVPFRIPKTDLSRLTLHFWRNWENNALPRMACCRHLDRNPETGNMEEGKPFGFCLTENPKKQSFVNLVYLNTSTIKPKAPGFEPLYVKILETTGKTTYLKILMMTITVDESAAPVFNCDAGTILLVETVKIPENEAPTHLQSLELVKIKKENPALGALRQRLFK